MITLSQIALDSLLRDKPQEVKSAILGRAKKNDNGSFCLSDEDYELITPETPKTPSPGESVFQMIGQVAQEGMKWAGAGFPVSGDAEFWKRKGLCEACPEWDTSKWGGSGGCSKCGCSRMMWSVATKHCPLDKW